MRPRCGAEMHPYEGVWGALLDPVVCGRPEGHTGQCRSVHAIRKERERSRDRWPAYRDQRQKKRERIRQLSREQQTQDAERLRDQLMDAVRAAAKQAEDKAMAAREVTWGLGMSSVCGVCGKVYWSAKGHKCKGPRK